MSRFIYRDYSFPFLSLEHRHVLLWHHRDGYSRHVYVIMHTRSLGHRNAIMAGNQSLMAQINRLITHELCSLTHSRRVLLMWMQCYAVRMRRGMEAEEAAGCRLVFWLLLELAIAGAGNCSSSHAALRDLLVHNGSGKLFLCYIIHGG